MIIKNAMVYHENGRFSSGDIYIEKDKIVQEDRGGEVIDATAMYAIPGLTDIHFHGCMNHDFCDGTPEAIEAMALYEAKQGVTTICPATMTLPEDTLLQIAECARAYEGHPAGAQLCGINMEGPFVSMKKRGAQNGDYIHEPDIGMYQRLQQASGGLFKLVAIAPEAEGAMAFIDALRGDTVLSIAHTDADYETAKKAMSHGVAHVTHFYNAMTPFTHRAPGVVGAVFDDPYCVAEMICDGVHIHPAAVRAAFKMLGDSRIILISDSMRATGMPDGEYDLGGQQVTVHGSHATLQDGTLAGSCTNLMDCMRTAVKQMNIPLESAVRCAAVNPAREIGIYDRFGSITPGKIANIVLLDSDLNTHNVILRGQLLN